jgi:acyl-coenzyme A thioesterase PaaI-like protein
MVHTLKMWWSRLAPFPGGKWFFSKIIGFLIPYTGTISPYVRELRPGYAKVSIKDRYRNRNHLASLHALAIANLGELTTGLALHFAMPDGSRAILTRLESEYLKKARGTIFSSAHVDTSTVQSGIVPVVASIVDERNTLVAKVTAYWLIDKSA